MSKHLKHARIALVRKSKKDGKDKESIQSS